MNIFHIAFNNLKRRKIKMLFLMLGLVVGVATVVAVINITQAMNRELGDRIDEFGANVVILPQAEGVEVHYGNAVTSDLTFGIQNLTMDDIPKIHESSVAQYINIVSPKLLGTVQAGDQTTLLVGVETQKEFTQKPWFSLAQQQGVEPGGKVGELGLLDLPEDGLILGASAAQALQLQVGETILINDRPFQVFGILNELGSEEDGLVYANLGVAQHILNRPQELSMIEISAYCNACPIEEIAMGLEEALPNGRIIPMREAALFREETIAQFSVFGLALSGVVLLVAALVVLTTMLSSVNDRTREIGILRAIGFRRGHIVQVILLEAGMISVLGGLAGYFLGSFAAGYMGPFLAQIQGEIPFQTELFLPSVLLSIIVALLTSIYPAIKAAQLDPAESLRFI